MPQETGKVLFCAYHQSQEKFYFMNATSCVLMGEMKKIYQRMGRLDFRSIKMLLTTYFIAPHLNTNTMHQYYSLKYQINKKLSLNK